MNPVKSPQCFANELAPGGACSMSSHKTPKSNGVGTQILMNTIVRHMKIGAICRICEDLRWIREDLPNASNILDSHKPAFIIK